VGLVWTHVLEEGVIHLPWRWRRYFPPKRQFKPDPHGAASQKTIFFIKLLNLHTYKVLHQRTSTIEIITGQRTYSSWYQHKKNKFSHSLYTWSCSFFYTSTVITGVQMWERCPSWVDRSDGLTETCGRIPCVSCMCCLFKSGRPSLHSNIFCGLRTHVGTIRTWTQNPSKHIHNISKSNYEIYYCHV
jgi:hypothetical protein